MPSKKAPEELAVEEAPIEEMAVEEAPIEEMAVEEAPIEELAVEEAPIEEMATEEAPIEEMAIEEAPIEEMAVEEAPIEEMAVEEAPTEEPPADEVALEETPAEEPSIEEAPVEEMLPEELAIEQAPAELPAEVASFSATYSPVVFTRESRAGFAVLPLAQSRYWGEPGTRLDSLEGLLAGRGARADAEDTGRFLAGCVVLLLPVRGKSPWQGKTLSRSNSCPCAGRQGRLRAVAEGR